MKDILGQPINIGDYVSVCERMGNTKLTVGKVIKIHPKSITVVTPPYINANNLVITHTSRKLMSKFIKLDEAAIDQHVKDVLDFEPCKILTDSQAAFYRTVIKSICSHT